MFTGGIARFLVAAHASGDKTEVRRITSSMFPVLVGVGAIIFSVGLLAAWKIETLLDLDPNYVGQARIMLVLIAGTMFWSVAVTPFQSGLYVRQEFVTINLIELGAEIFRVSLLLTLLFGVGTKVMWLVIASSAGSVVSSIVQVILSRRRVPEIRFDRQLVSLKQVKTLLSFSLWSCTEMYSSLAAKALPLLFLNRFAGPLAVAQYHLANLADSQTKAMLAAAMRPAQPALTSLHAMGRSDLLKKLYYSGGRYHLWILLLPAAPIIWFGADLMELYAGAAYRDAGYVLMAFYLRYPFTYASAMYYRLAHAAGKIRTYYICDALLQSCIIVAIYVTLRFGGGGAAAAAWCACIAQSVFHLFVIWPLGIKFIDGSWRDFLRKTLLPGYLPLAVSGGVCFGLDSVLEANDLMSLILVFGAGGLANLATIGLVSFNSTDRELLLKVTGKIRRKLSPTLSQT
jgi:O-antigen/teichoic acid export membrane protein